MTKCHNNNVTKMLLYKKSNTNNLTQRENKYAIGEDNSIYFVETILLKNKEERKK